MPPHKKFTPISTDVSSPPAAEKDIKTLIAKREADLSICPEPLDVDKEHQHDLHANAMKLIYTLIEEGFLTLSKKNYENFAR